MSIMGFFVLPHAQHDMRRVGRTPPQRDSYTQEEPGAPATLSAVGIDTDVPVVVEGHNRVRLRVGPFHAR